MLSRFFSSVKGVGHLAHAAFFASHLVGHVPERELQPAAVPARVFEPRTSQVSLMPCAFLRVLITIYTY
jgi:hypothetical protein